MPIIITLLLLASSAFAGTLKVVIKDRPVHLALPVILEVERFDPSRDYDQEILNESLAFFERCATAAVNEDEPTLMVPSWRALLGLSTRVIQFEYATERVPPAHMSDPLWLTIFVKHRGETFDAKENFLTAFTKATSMVMPEPTDFRLLARAAVLALRDGANAEFIGWLWGQMATLPAHALRRSTTLAQAAQTKPLRSCAPNLNAKIIPFKQK